MNYVTTRRRMPASHPDHLARNRSWLAVFAQAAVRLLAAFILLATCGLASAEALRVSIDTSGFGTASGYLDLQFGASAGGPLATATVGNLAGFAGATVVESWGVTAVPGGWVFRNDTANDLFQAVGFGGTLSFDLVFDGTHDAAAAFVSPFAIAAFDAAYAPVGAADPFTGALATFLWTPPSAAGAAGTVTLAISDANVTVSAVPEPAQWLLMAAGLAGMALLRRRKNS